mmetsp:Transcript_130923/g.230764  ORF Transcript_130923/g.230764 Transcript_130923/m.230764 type:complete len:475 (-) Transcript_130923:140-1564(-)
MRRMALRFLILIFTLACQGQPAVPEGDCLASGGCTDGLDDEVSALQVMLQLELGSRKPRLEPSSAASRASSVAAPASARQEKTQRTSVDLKPSLNAAPTLLQIHQEQTHHPTRRTASAAPVMPVMPSEFTERAPLQPKPPEHAAASQASFDNIASPGVLWWERSFSCLLGQHFSTIVMGMIAFCAILYAGIRLIFCRTAAKSIWADRRKQKEEALPANSRGLEARLPEAVASFAMPFVSLANRSTKVESFDIPEASGAVKLRGALSRLSPGGTWAKVEIFAGHGTTPGASAPLASCSLAGSAADIERMNVTGALDSWLSLLMHDKSQGSTECGDTSDEDTDEVMPAACDGEVSEEESVKSDSRSLEKHRSLPRLEVKDGIGSVLGILQPNREGNYSFLRQNQMAFELELRLNDKWISLKKDGKACALVTSVLQGGSPECTPEEFLQVDILTHAKSEETVLMLTCVLTMIALNAS